MQNIRNFRSTPVAQLASGAPVFAGLTVTFANGLTGLRLCAGLALARGMSEMQCSGGPVSMPGGDA